jgi:ribose-phosphate pyrophosphokinase
MYDIEVPMSPDEHFQDLKRIISAAGGKARRINVIMPMLYEGRQHKRTARESLDCAMALRELGDMGVNNIITFDAHDTRVQNAVPLIGFENIHPTYQMLKALVHTIPDLDIDREHMSIISPDEGGLSRCIYYSSVLGLDLGMFYKRRDYTKIIGGRNPIISHEYLGGSIEGKDVILVDDIISSGDSILDIAQQLKRMNVKRVFVFASFGLFCEGLERFDEAYRFGLFEKVFTTNLVYRPNSLRAREWYSEVDMSKYVSLIIDTLNYDRSISNLLNPVHRIHKLLDGMHK